MSTRNSPVPPPKKEVANKTVKQLLDNALNFGPDHDAISADASGRLREIVKKLQEIGARIDELSSKF